VNRQRTAVARSGSLLDLFRSSVSRIKISSPVAGRIPDGVTTRLPRSIIAITV